MIEIVCPSCGARYQVPDDSIGSEGRKVTCSSCSHKWRAYPPAAEAARPEEAESPAGTSAEPAAGTPDETPAESPAAAPAAAYAGEPEEETAGSQPAAGGGREEQMDTIRRMLDDLKRNAETEPEPEPEPEPERRPAGPPPSARRREETLELDDDSGGDPLKSRINQLGGGTKQEKPSNYDAARLRRMHERRAKRLQRAKARQRKSGAFLTGFTLVTAVAATMVALYVMSPRISASSPELAPAMNEYVVTVDRYRTALDDATAEWRGWVTERVGELTGGEGEQAGGETGGQTGATVQEQEPAATE